MIEQKVSLNERTYPIHIGDGAFGLAVGELGEFVRSGGSAVCVADAEVLRLFPERAERLAAAGIPSIPVGGGEGSKRFAELERLCEAFAGARLDRKSFVAAWGGGVIGDLAGFAAAVYMRGVELVQIPTTLLSMVDSSVGGKTGINICAGKNLVGAFHQPRAVYIDTSFLSTLPSREFSAGLAEVVKCGALGDAELFENLERQGGDFGFGSDYLPEAVRRSCALKASIVSADERETAAEGGRALLNFGHTLGHAVEKCAGYGEYVHGEAVAIGMAFAARLSEGLDTLSSRDSARIFALLEKFSLPTRVPRNLGAGDLIAAMRHDKKAVGGKLRFVLLDGIGRSYTRELGGDFVENALESQCSKG